jgi:hypothetical protein
MTWTYSPPFKFELSTIENDYGLDKFHPVMILIILVSTDQNPSQSVYRGGKHPMTDQNRGIMKFDSADTPMAIAISGLVIIGSIVALVIWALNTAYNIS